MYVIGTASLDTGCDLDKAGGDPESNYWSVIGQLNVFISDNVSGLQK